MDRSQPAQKLADSTPKKKDSPNPVKLSQMSRGESAEILGFSLRRKGNRVDQEDQLIANRLFELGLAIGETLTVSHKSALGEHSFVVEAAGILIALRKQEADMILLERKIHQ